MGDKVLSILACAIGIIWAIFLIVFYVNNTPLWVLIVFTVGILGYFFRHSISKFISKVMWLFSIKTVYIKYRKLIQAIASYEWGCNLVEKKDDKVVIETLGYGKKVLMEWIISQDLRAPESANGERVTVTCALKCDGFDRPFTKSFDPSVDQAVIFTIMLFMVNDWKLNNLSEKCEKVKNS